MQLVPTTKIQIFPSKYSRTIKVVAFFHPRASYTIMNPNILPSQYWKYWKIKEKNFHIANNDIFCTDQI